MSRIDQLLDAAAATSGDERAQLLEAAVLEGMPLALSAARRYGRAGHREDLQQVAALALIRAVRNYRPGVGPAFAAYALPTIHGELKRHHRDHGWVLRPPRRLQELYWAARTPYRELTQKYHREPSPAEVASYLGVPEEAVREVATAARGLVATPLDDLEGDHTGWAPHLATADPALDRLIDWQSVLPSLDALPSRSRQIVAMYFFGGLHQTRIGAELGISQAQVSRELSSVLRQIRATLDQAERADDRGDDRDAAAGAR